MGEEEISARNFPPPLVAQGPAMQQDIPASHAHREARNTTTTIKNLKTQAPRKGGEDRAGERER
mgnify:FL=1